MCPHHPTVLSTSFIVLWSTERLSFHLLMTGPKNVFACWEIFLDIDYSQLLLLGSSHSLIR